MPPESEESRIERLKRTLYSRNENIVPKEKRSTFSPTENSVPTNWGEKPSYDIQPEMVIKRNNSFFNKFLYGSLAFFGIAVALAIFIFYGGINMISSNNLNIEVIAPTSVSSGEELTIGLSIINENRTDLENLTLFVDYPEGTYSALDDTKEMTQEQIDLGVLGKGDTLDHSVRALLFGEKDTVRNFIFRVEYKVKGSNATFSKEKTYDVLIGSSPLLLDVSYAKEVNSGQDMTMTIDVTSNSSVPVKDALIKIEYPYGYTYKTSNVKPIRDNSIWSIGDLKNGDKKTITVTGSIIGQNMEDRSFRISVGTKTGSAYDFETSLASTLVTTGIRKSFYDLAVSAYNDGIAKPGDAISANIRWQNTLPDKIIDTKIEVKLSGNALDRSKVNVSSGGFYRSVDDTVLWDKNGTPQLVEMSPGDSGQVTLSVSSIQNLIQPTLVKNPYINLKINITGERAGRDAGTVSTVEDVVFKISSQVNLSAKTYKAVGPFSNSGPMPPRADQESTYTVNWVLTNTTSDVKGTVVRATLPQGVTWKGEVSPQTEKITYDQDTRLITWDIGNVLAGSGYTNSPRQVYFKVGLTPSLNQVGGSPNIVSQANLTSTDTYTTKPIETSAAAASTKFSDPSFITGNDVVVK